MPAMIPVPKKAFILAAGLGTRMRPLTDNIPKPMVEAQGRTLIDRTLDKLVEAGVEEAVVNTHYKAEVLQEHLAKRNDLKIYISHEPILLETGGGVANALGKLGDEPFYAVTSDVILAGDGLEQLADSYVNGRAGALLLHEVATAYGYEGNGDFNLFGVTGRIILAHEGMQAKYVFTGAQILNPELFSRPKVLALGVVFPLGKVYRIFCDDFIGVVNKGKWYHIGTPEALNNLEPLQA